jgi:alanine racemase
MGAPRPARAAAIPRRRGAFEPRPSPPDPADRATAVLDIDLAAIAANWRFLAATVAPARCAAVVKANGYGLGAAPVAAALLAAGCRHFYVATLDEGIALRAALGADPAIAVLNGPPPGATGDFVDNRLIPVLNHPGQIECWQQEAARRGGLPAILHIDTGLARLGLSPADFAALADQPGRAGAVRWCGLVSHLACADTSDHPLNREQRARFLAARRRWPEVPASLAASSGIFLGADFHFAEVRPGAALYGVNPCPGTPNPMRPCVRLHARILQLRQIDRGEPVGYGAAHVMDRPALLAIVAVGYADGWLRSLSHRGCGWFAGQRLPLLGRVSMDLATFDVSAIDPAKLHPGMMIELIGDCYGVDDAAADAGTIGYEILCALGQRYHRVYRQPPVE